jgi:hypothetical protein
MSQALFVCAAAVLAAAPSARAEKTQAISVEHGVTVIHGHLDTTTILPESKVKILEPIVGPGHDPNARWLEWVDTYRIAAAHAVEPAPPRIRRPAPPVAIHTDRFHLHSQDRLDLPSARGALSTHSRARVYAQDRLDLSPQALRPLVTVAALRRVARFLMGCPVRAGGIAREVAACRPRGLKPAALCSVGSAVRAVTRYRGGLAVS